MALLLFSSLAVIALVCADARRPRLFALSKPLATLCLLGVAGSPTQPFGLGIVVGLGLSALGDAALLRKHQRLYFLAGMGFFLLAHGSYIVAFLRSGEGRASVAALLATLLAATGVVVVMRHIWQGIHTTLRAPCVVYGLAISALLGAATVFQGAHPGALGSAVLAGAVLFYAGDVALALSLFGRPMRYGQTLSMALYWLGQLGFALAAQWQSARAG